MWTQETTMLEGLFPMTDSFRSRFLKEAGERPYAWVAAIGLPKTLVTAVLRGGEDYRPIKRTVEKLAFATGKSVTWWLTGEEHGAIEPAEKAAPAVVEQERTPNTVPSIAAGGRADPELLALAVRALEEWAAERHLEIDPKRKGAIISVLYDYLRKGADEQEVENLLTIVS